MNANSEHDRDQAWYDALTGRAAGDGVDAREGDALRNVLLNEDERAGRRTASGEIGKLLERLEEEELVEPKPQPSRRPRWFAIAASVALAALIAPLVMQVMHQQQPVLIEIPRGAVEPVEVRGDRPEQVSAELAAGLTDLGATVDRYEYEGRWIIDAHVSGLPPRKVKGLLERFGVAAPEDGRVLLAFAAESHDNE